jgi:hypothetical protein
VRVLDIRPRVASYAPSATALAQEPAEPRRLCGITPHRLEAASTLMGGRARRLEPIAVDTADVAFSCEVQ